MSARSLSSLPIELEAAKMPSVVVRDSETGSSYPPPPSSRRRARVLTLRGLGEDLPKNLASLERAVREASDYDDEYSDVDELLARSYDCFEVDAF
ncbi:MAG: hypothetical protein U0263_13575 [Polyangiaceae bacterium]